MCPFENGLVSHRITKWLRKISVLIVFVGQQGKKREVDKERLGSELIPGPLNVLPPPLVERSKIVFPPLHKNFA